MDQLISSAQRIQQTPFNGKFLLSSIIFTWMFQSIEHTYTT